MHAGAVEASRYIRNPLDVLAQQIVAIVGRDPIGVDDLERLIHGSAPFAELPRTQLENVLDMLSGRYPSDEFADLRPRVVWDRIAGTVRAREGAARVALTSGGTIPDRGLYGVFLVGADPGKGRVGELDEEMVDWRVCVLTPFGGKVHAPWAMAIGAMVRERSDLEIDVLWTDDGIVARFPEAERAPDPQLVLPDPERAEALVIERLGQTPLFAARF